MAHRHYTGVLPEQVTPPGERFAVYAAGAPEPAFEPTAGAVQYVAPKTDTEDWDADLKAVLWQRDQDPQFRVLVHDLGFILDTE